MRLSRPVVCALLATSVFLATGLPALAATNVCDFQAYSDDSDPAGTNVRSGPGTAFGVTGVLVPTRDLDGYLWSPEFAVTGFENGWFQIGDATAGQYGEGPEVRVFEGPGWVSARLVEFAIEDWNLRAGPSWDASVILEMAVDTPWYLDSLRVQTVHACDGRFLEVTLVNEAGDTRRGWVNNICGNQATTCSMGSGRFDAEAE
jgi:hypothetical protein